MSAIVKEDFNYISLHNKRVTYVERRYYLLGVHGNTSFCSAVSSWQQCLHLPQGRKDGGYLVKLTVT